MSNPADPTSSSSPMTPSTGADFKAGSSPTSSYPGTSQYNESLLIWQKFLSIGGQQATLEQAKEFQGLVLKAMCSQIQEEQDRAVEALRKMREDNEESQS